MPGHVWTCLGNSSKHWECFVQLSLITNMRSEGHNDLNQWLFNIGTDVVQLIEGTTVGTIQIPPKIIIDEDIVGAIHFCIDVTRRIGKTSYFVPIRTAIQLNSEVIRKLPGKPHIY